MELCILELLGKQSQGIGVVGQKQAGRTMGLGSVMAGVTQGIWEQFEQQEGQQGSAHFLFGCLCCFSSWAWACRKPVLWGGWPRVISLSLSFLF